MSNHSGTDDSSEQALLVRTGSACGLELPKISKRFSTRSQIVFITSLAFYAIKIVCLVLLVASVTACKAGAPQPKDLRRAALEIRKEMPTAELISMLGRPTEEFGFEARMLQYGDINDERGMLVVFVDIDETVSKWAWSRGEEVVVSETVWQAQKVRQRVK